MDKKSEFFESLKKSQERVKARLKKMHPPKDVMKYINDKTDETFKINKGNLDKQSFKLGMVAMWIHLKPLSGEVEGEKVVLRQNISLAIEFEDSWEFDDRIPESNRWLAILHSMPGIVVVASTKDEAFNQIMISLKVKAAYDSKYLLPSLPTSGIPEGSGE